jgi:hypothetical protein
MSGETTSSEDITGRLLKVLLSYLQDTRVIEAWPGVDGMTIDDIVGFYPEAVAAGEVPDWQDLLRRHPDLADELQRWLAAKDRWQFALQQQVEAPRTDRRDTKARRQEGNA